VSCRVVSCRVVSCRVVSCRVVSCRVVSCRAVYLQWRLRGSRRLSACQLCAAGVSAGAHRVSTYRNARGSARAHRGRASERGEGAHRHHPLLSNHMEVLSSLHDTCVHPERLKANSRVWWWYAASLLRLVLLLVLAIDCRRVRICWRADSHRQRPDSVATGAGA
jgi:hypothetical protein